MASGVEGFFSQVAVAIHYALHPLSTLLGRLGLGATGDVDIPFWALLAWLLGSRENEAAKKLGFILAVGLSALATVEYVLTD